MSVARAMGEDFNEAQVTEMAKASIRALGNLTLADVTDVMNILCKSLFPSETRKSLVALAREKMGAGVVAPAVRVGYRGGAVAKASLPMVHILDSPLYLTEQNWRDLTDPHAVWADHKAVLINRCKQLGAVNVCEQTAKRMLATVILATTPPGRTVEPLRKTSAPKGPLRAPKALAGQALLRARRAPG